MLNNLITTVLLTMGVANVTPICNKAETQNSTTSNQELITTNYTEQINIPSQWQTNEVTNQILNNTNTTPYNTGNIKDYKGDILKTSTYINVKGNIYITHALKQANEYLESNEILYMTSYDYMLNNNGNIYEKTTRMFYCFQLTPYNINRSTEMKIGLHINLGNLTPSGSGLNATYQNIYLKRKIYTTSQENWANYLDLQMTSNMCNYLEHEIEDPNSNYYYELDESLLNVTDITDDNYMYYDIFNMTIVQNTKTYIFVEYIPIIDAQIYDQYEDDYFNYNYYNVMNVNGELWPIDWLYIEGTNIIANTTYEVIDLPGLMWEVLTMPFAFVSQAFNLTLFPGTPYQLNISNLFLSLIAIFVFVWVITLFLKMKG